MTHEDVQLIVCLQYNMEIPNFLEQQAKQAARRAARKESLFEVFDLCFDLNYP